MAYFSKEEIIFTKIMSLKPTVGTVDDKARAWLPVTCIDEDNPDGRVTLRAPYPIGDGDVDGTVCPYCEGLGHVTKHECLECTNGYKTEQCSACNGTGWKDAECDEEEREQCEVCNGTCSVQVKCQQCDGTGIVTEISYDPSDAECEHCHGTGILGGAVGAITVDADGIITLRYDDVSLGIDDHGRIFGRLKVKDEKSGLDIERIDGKDNVFVKVDTKSIRINDDGCLEVVDYVKPYAEQFSNSVVFTQDISYSGTPISLSDGDKEIVVDDEAVKKIHVHLSVGIRYDRYWSATSMTRLQMNVGGKLSEIFCWDQTIPYTIVNFDTFIDVSNERTVPVWLKFKEGATDDSIPEGATFSWTANVTSC